MDNVKIVFLGTVGKKPSQVCPMTVTKKKLIKGIIANGGKSARIWCCKACSDKYGVTEEMEKAWLRSFPRRQCHLLSAENWVTACGTGRRVKDP